MLVGNLLWTFRNTRCLYLQRSQWRILSNEVFADTVIFINNSIISSGHRNEYIFLAGVDVSVMNLEHWWEFFPIKVVTFTSNSEKQREVDVFRKVTTLLLNSAH